MQPIAIQLKATAAGNSSFNAAAPVIKDLNILPPGKDAFFNERMMDDRYTSVRAKFARKLLARKDLGKIKDLDGDGDTDLDDAVDRITFGAFYQSGQSCIGVQRKNSPSSFKHY